MMQPQVYSRSSAASGQFLPMVEGTKAARLHEAIRDAGHSWSSAALAIGKTAQAPTKWKKGQIGNDTVEALARLTGWNYAYLLTGEGPKKAGQSEPAAVHKPGSSENTPENAPIEGAIAIRKKGIPVVGTAQLGDQGFWEELQYPVGHGDGFVDYPSSDPNAYALRCNGTSMEPRFRHGEFLIIEPNFPVNPGDEVMVKLADGRCMAKIFAYARDGLLHLESVNQAHEKITVARDQIEKMHYIAGVAKRGLHRSA